MKERYKASLLTATRNLENIFWWWAADWQSNVHSPWPNELTICADTNGFQIPVETSCIGPRWCKAKDFFLFCSGKICLVCFHGFFVLLFYISSVSVTQINAQTPITAILSTYLRVAVCKDRESAVSNPFGESLIFCPKLALGRLFSKIIFKSSNDFVYLGNLRKIKSAVKMRSKCGFLVDQKVRWWTSAEVLK